MPEGLDYLFAATCSPAAGTSLQGPAPHSGQICCFQGTGSGSGGVWPPLNVLPWLSALGGVASGSWEGASGFGPWNSWPLGGGLSQAHWPSPRQLSTPRIDGASREVQLALPVSPVTSWRQASALAWSPRPGSEVCSPRCLHVTPRSHTLVLGVIICRGWTNYHCC